MKQEYPEVNRLLPEEFSRREFLETVAGGSSALLGASLIPHFAGRIEGASQASGRPNIVLILADDMGYSDIGCFGGEMRTPNIDRLAESGLRFSHFHNSARCCPSRASLLTGLYPHQAGVGDMMNDQGVDGYRGDLNRRCVTIAEVMRGAGYGTYAAGKWHVTRYLPPEGPKHNWPLQRGFDRYFGTITGAASYFEPDTLVRDNTPIEPGRGFYYTDAIADHAVDFIRSHRQSRQNQPFFLYCAFTAPHWPLHAPEDEIARYKGRFDKGWDVLRAERHRRMIEMEVVAKQWRLSPRDSQVPAWADAENKAWQLRRMEVYAAQVDIMDRGIGRIVAALESTGALADTLILFLSDNGGCHEELTESWSNYFFSNREKVSRRKTFDGREVRFFNNPDVLPGADDTYQSYGRPWANLSNTPFRLFKTTAHEGGVATPLVVHWPRAIKTHGEFRRPMSHIIDIMATCVEVSGAKYPTEVNGEAIQSMEGRSLVPAFSGGAIEREAIYCEHEGNRAVITEEWKLVARGWRGAWELYNMIADRTETNNLAAENPDQVALLAGMWDAWARRVKVFPRPGQAGT
jgi:arylsulfatase A-like enzyme